MSQPVPPTFKDIGKSANDLLNRDFPISGNKLEVKTLSPSGVKFIVDGTQSQKDGSIAASLKAEYKDKKSGVEFTQGWTTANALITELSVENQVAKGLKLDVTSALFPATGGKDAKVGVIYKQPGFHSRGYLDLFKGPTFLGDAVVGQNGFLAGAQVEYDVLDGRVTKYNTAVGFSAPEYSVALHGHNQLSVFTASYYHRVNAGVEAGGKALWDSKTPDSQVALEVGSKVFLDQFAFVKAKINNRGGLALGYTQVIRPGVKLGIGAAVDTQRLHENAHKVGFSLLLEG